MNEPRKYQRFNAEGDITLKKKGDSSPPVQAHLVDISFAGLGLLAPGPLEPGCDFLIELTIKPWPEKLNCEGKVKYAQEIKKGEEKTFRVGIEFTSIDTKTIQNIINRIQQVICEQIRQKEQPKTSPPHPRYF